MTVHCEGECRLIEQTGEKQDFEAVLGRLALPHENFVLQVRRLRKYGRDAEPGLDYQVTVTALAPERLRMYQGSAAQSWVAQVTLDLESGFFGSGKRS